MVTLEISTDAGPARAEIEPPSSGAARLLLALTHGAGGGTGSADLLAARRAGLGAGAVVAMITQPYRVAGGRAPGSAMRQDAAWLQVIDVVRKDHPWLTLVQGGRSNGARLACRTAQAAGAAAVIALAFPLHPPGKAGDPSRSRAGELRAAGVPVLVINGDRDPFGVPDAADAGRLVVLPGETHALTRDLDAIAAEVGDWLTGVLRAGA